MGVVQLLQDALDIQVPTSNNLPRAAIISRWFCLLLSVLSFSGINLSTHVVEASGDRFVQRIRDLALLQSTASRESSLQKYKASSLGSTAKGTVLLSQCRAVPHQDVAAADSQYNTGMPVKSLQDRIIRDLEGERRILWLDEVEAGNFLRKP